MKDKLPECCCCKGQVIFAQAGQQGNLEAVAPFPGRPDITPLSIPHAGQGQMAASQHLSATSTLWLQPALEKIKNKKEKRKIRPGRGIR